jgi:hypothetical protein
MGLHLDADDLAAPVLEHEIDFDLVMVAIVVEVGELI